MKVPYLMKNQLLIENNGAVRDIHTNVAENYYFHPYSPKFVTISFYEEKKRKLLKSFWVSRNKNFSR